MSDLILPSVAWPGLPPEASTRVGEPVQGAVLSALGRAAVHLLGARGRHALHRAMAAWSVPSAPQPPEMIRCWWPCRFHCDHVAVLVRYQGLELGKAAVTLRVALHRKTAGGSFEGAAADEILFDAARGTLSVDAVVDDGRPGGRRWPLQEAFTGTSPQDGAGVYVIRPLTMPAGAPREMGIVVTASEHVRVVSIDVWELFEEAITQ